MRTKYLTVALIQWIKAAYHQDIEYMNEEQEMRLEALIRVVEIVEINSESTAVLRAFQEWKRLPFKSCLRGLQEYSKKVNKKSAATRYNK